MDSGWEWANLPASRTQRLALQYKPGERKTWYCPAGSLPHKAYLTCLLECERLGLEIVPHWSPSPAACYGRLLDGKGPAVRQARPRLMLMNDVDDDFAQGDGAGVVPDAEASPMIGDEVAQQNISEGSEDDSLMRELERLLEDDDEEASAPAPGAASSGSQPELSESLPGVSVAAGAALDLPHEPEAEAHVAQPSRVERGARLQPVVPGQIQHWGVFRISSLKPKAPTRPFGALEALCPFHKRSVKSECKKYIAHKSSSPEDHALDLKALKHWCSQAKTVHLQRDHIRMKPLDRSMLSGLSNDFLESKRIDEGPSEEPVPDDVHDAEQSAGSARSGKAKAKGKAKASSKPKAKVLAKAAPTHASGEGSSSSSSSSSSGSSTSQSSCSSSNNSSSSAD